MSEPLDSARTVPPAQPPPDKQAYFDEVRAKNAAQKQRLAELKAKQTLPGGIAGGVLGMIVGVVIWTVVTAVTRYHIGWIATIVGVCTGLGVRYLGKGLTHRSDFRIAAALLAGVGCFVGDALSAVAVTAWARGIPFLDLLLDPGVLATLPGAVFAIESLIFYSIAMVAAYRIACSPIPGDLMDHT